MSALQPVQPQYGGKVGATNGSAPGMQVAGVASVAGTVAAGCKQVIVNNKGTIWVHFYIGVEARAATALDLGIPPGTQQVFTKDQDAVNYSFIAPDGAGSSIQVCNGEGW